MKRRDLMKKLKDAAKERGEELVEKDGRGPHTKVTIGNLTSSVPRHNEINEYTAKGILADMEVES